MSFKQMVSLTSLKQTYLSFFSFLYENEILSNERRAEYK